MNDYKADYHHRLIPCSATMLVVCLVIISNNSLTNRHMDIHRVFKNGKNHVQYQYTKIYIG